jgi:hypothetical protein
MGESFHISEWDPLPQIRQKPGNVVLSLRLYDQEAGSGSELLSRFGGFYFVVAKQLEEPYAHWALLMDNRYKKADFVSSCSWGRRVKSTSRQ